MVVVVPLASNPQCACGFRSRWANRTAFPNSRANVPKVKGKNTSEDAAEGGAGNESLRPMPNHLNLVSQKIKCT